MPVRPVPVDPAPPPDDGAGDRAGRWAAACEPFLREQTPSDAAHDLAHVRRVVAWAGRLGREEGADPDVVLPAAWLHDCVALAKDHPARRTASRLAAERAAAWLRSRGEPEARVAAVAHAVEAHSFSAGVEPRTVEAAVVQDADRLDALGAVGVARLYATAGALGSALVHPADPVPSWADPVPPRPAPRPRPPAGARRPALRDRPRLHEAPPPARHDADGGGAAGGRAPGGVPPPVPGPARPRGATGRRPGAGRRTLSRAGDPEPGGGP